MPRPIYFYSRSGDPQARLLSTMTPCIPPSLAKPAFPIALVGLTTNARFPGLLDKCWGAIATGACKNSHMDLLHLCEAKIDFESKRFKK
jgi:hypothetical protein